MDYRVEKLAAVAGVRVDTLRFYQARGILPAPRREGRIALYGDDHLFEIGDDPNGGARAVLEIPYRRSEEST